MWKEGERRKSPRISAEAAEGGGSNSNSRSRSKSKTRNGDDGISINKNKNKNKMSGPASRTRARKKTKLRPLQHVSAIAPPTSCSSHISQSQDTNSNSVDGEGQFHPELPQNRDKPVQHSDNSHHDHGSSVPWMPAKHLLENILDILQRRDNYEIFAEPVNPEEVEDYYEIIKQPMDFGTMRAKLHEGMYASLEQFEHDVFLISKNAMHFNSSTTIYFRQARVIDELAKKVFHALKTDRENFEFEFSDTRRRTSRRPQFAAKGPSHGASPKFATNTRSSSTSVNLLSKSTTSPLNGSSNLRRTSQRNPGSSGGPNPLRARDHETPFAPRDGRKTGLSETDRRSTYIPGTSFLEENDSIVSAHNSILKPMINVKQQDSGYRESLLLFVKELGPTAQMVAKRKLDESSAKSFSSSSNCCFQMPTPQTPVPATQRLPTMSASTLRTLSSKSTFSENFNGHHVGPENNKNMDDKVHTEGNSVMDFSSTSSSRQLNFPSVSEFGDCRGKSAGMVDDSQVWPAMGYSGLDMLRLKSINNQNLTSLWTSPTMSNESVALNPHFRFDLPHLRMWLDQINKPSRDGLLLQQQWSGFGGASVHNTNQRQGADDNCQKLSANSKQTDVVLQL